MKTVQKLELYSSIGFLLVVMMGLLLSIFTFENNEETTWAAIFFGILINLMFPSMLFAGAYIHTVKRETLGFGFLMFFGSVFLCIYGYASLIGFSVGHVVNASFLIATIMLMLSFLLVGATMIFATINFLLSQKESGVS